MKPMRAMRLATSGSALIEESIPRPIPGPGELLIHVHAAGITPTELIWYPTAHTKSGEARVGAVPSHEFSGEIAEIGEGIQNLTVGQEVYGMNDWFADGALAEYCVTKPQWIAPKLALSHVDAASVPIGALTAWQGLFDRAHLSAGERVLVNGGAGAVGVFAIQLARFHGAHVITTVSEHNAELAKELGANEVIDYKSGPFEEKVRNVDVVFDTVGGDTLQRSWAVLKTDGRLVAIAAGETTSDERSKRAFFVVEPNHRQLSEIRDLLLTGELRCVVDTVLPFSEAAAAYTGGVKKQGRGKIVVQVAE